MFLYTLQGRRLLIIGTTSRQEVLREMEMLSAFSTVVHVSNISTADQLIAAVTELNAASDTGANSAFSPKEIHELAKKVDGKK